MDAREATKQELMEALLAQQGTIATQQRIIREYRKFVANIIRELDFTRDALGIRRGTPYSGDVARAAIERMSAPR